MKLRNWIEQAIGKRMAWTPCHIGKKGGMDLYSVTFEDGTEAGYLIDFDRKIVEEY